jgi:hypothetical protein
MRAFAAWCDLNHGDGFRPMPQSSNFSKGWGGCGESLVGPRYFEAGRLQRESRPALRHADDPHAGFGPRSRDAHGIDLLAAPWSSVAARRVRAVITLDR